MAFTTHASFAFGKVLLGSKVLIAREREVAREPVDSVPQHGVVDGRRPAVV